MRSLTWKLSGALLLIVAIAVGLTAYLTNLNTETEFRRYLVSGNMMFATSTADEIGDYYEITGDWDAIRNNIDSFVASPIQRLAIADTSGRIVADSSDEWLDEKADDLGLTNGSEIIASGRTVGYLYAFSTSMTGRGYHGGQGMMMTTPEVSSEDDFLNTLNDSLWKVALITGAIALVIGLLLTRQIIRPVRKLIAGSRQLSQGNLSHRIDVKSHDEIGELADSFNSMAESLEKIEQSRRQLTADIAHELRTPLTIIDGTVNGIIDEVFPADKEHLDSIMEQTSRLTHLINDLRDISLAESGQLKLNLESTDLDELTGRVVTGLKVSAGEKNINLSYHGTSGLPDIEVDPFRIEQVVSNLVRNAIRHTPENGSITVKLETLMRGIELTVSDTGEGILPEDLPHVFERFYRTGGSRSREKGGTGLGLAIVKQMVEAHGGSVRVSSKPGEGAVFTITLESSR